MILNIILFLDFLINKEENDNQYVLKNYELAINDYNIVIELDSNYIGAYINRGEARKQLGNIEQALDDYNKVIEIDSDFSEAYYNRGMAKYFLGDESGACIDWSKAMELGYKDAKKALEAYCKY